MPPTGALYSDSADTILEDIENQFRLDTDTLVGLTRAYLDELAEGLATYGKPLAIM
jgi:hexokinase